MGLKIRRILNLLCIVDITIKMLLRYASYSLLKETFHFRRHRFDSFNNTQNCMPVLKMYKLKGVKMVALYV